MLNKDFKLLDFAPSPTFSKHLKRIGITHVSTDLMRTDMDINLDICDMSTQQSDTYDFIICSHILEHVNDPDIALSELFRTLKRGGQAILMVPLFNRVENTIENSQFNTEELRWKHYGQFDHVRLFSRTDFINKIKEAGFELNVYTRSDFDKTVTDKNAISDNSKLYVGFKR
jgi:2-polyprenyl-3-methyl-5-hydroxy-6-metoxy-1,4-benzoquinol methylase